MYHWFAPLFIRYGQLGVQVTTLTVRCQSFYMSERVKTREVFAGTDADSVGAVVKADVAVAAIMCIVENES